MSKKAHGDDEQIQSLKDGKFIPHKEQHQKAGEFIKSAVYGGLDGMITTYSVVMGAFGVGILFFIYSIGRSFYFSRLSIGSS